jgi:lipopolysaccharide/colanic/teichoic acid biosynthesis glycosyltransferase
MKSQRVFDICISASVLLLLAPLFLLISIALRLTGEGKIFYRQVRVGKNKACFQLLKFATMLENSPNLEGGEITKLNDSRILPFGIFLRKTKLNELPQVLNILLGDMSLVGPRPLTPTTFSWYGEIDGAVISSVTPGLTGVGSMIFRDEEKILTVNNTAEFYKNIISPYKSELEVWYVKNMNFGLNCKIMFLTALFIAGVNPKLCFRTMKALPLPPRQIAQTLLV